MKPHEIIEIIFTEACNTYRTTASRVLYRSEQGFVNKERKYSKVRVIAGALIAKYLGVEFAADIMGTDCDTISVYQAHHKAYCGTNEVVTKLTIDIVNAITAPDYNAASSLNNSPIYIREATDVHEFIKQLNKRA